MDVLTLSRFQFGDTAAFHIIWPLMSVGFSVFMVTMEAMWLRTGEEKYYRQLRFWLKIFVLTFAIGVASGFPLSFQFGTNWATFSDSAGSFFGNILGFETTIAFTLETASLGIFLFGWKRVSKKVHFISNCLILFGASLSAFWIVVANSWMQIPRGVVYEGGKIIVVDYMAAIFNPDALVSFAHMWIACIVSTMFLISGISAIVLLSKKANEATHDFFARSLRYALMISLVFIPIQMIVGDMFGKILAENQPAKLAAYELHWDTNAPGAGAPLNLFAIPSKDGGENVFEIAVPNVLSYIVTRTPDGTIQGLNDFAPENRPTVVQAVLIFIAFRVMVGLGILMFLITAWGGYLWYRRELRFPDILYRKWFLRACVVAIPFGFIATETGWMVREIGRQPWVIYNIMRTSEALSPNLSASVVTATIVGLTVLYALCAFFFVYFVVRIVRKGPNLTSLVP